MDSVNDEEFSGKEISQVMNFAFKKHREYFKDEPSIVAYAPGRVNLIGEHTDYNDGFVLPMALPFVTVAAGRKTDRDECRIVTTNNHIVGTTSVILNVSSINESLEPGKPAWANYIKGVMAHFKGKLCAFDVVIASAVPVGGGLSSSAAIEVAMFTFLEALVNGKKSSSHEERAKACQKAEHEFCGMPCGIMDQFISFLGKEDHAVLLDCRSLKYEYVPLLNLELSILIINTNVRHELSSSEYPLRKKQCEEAAKVLGKTSLRDASLKELEASRNDISDVVYRRAKHVITEIERTLQSAEALKKGDYEMFGHLMCKSHMSLRDDYEVSCPELDEVVNAVMECDGVYGSRMTGGGFGGCTVTLLKSSVVPHVIRHVKEKYSGRPDFYECRPSGGAGVTRL